MRLAAAAKKTGRVVLVLLMVYLFIVLAMMFLENSLVYFPSQYPEGDWNPPGLVFEDAWFNAADGTRLHGWFVPHERPRAVTLFLHGNAGNITHRDDMLRELHRLGVAVLALDYRGYGRSEGSPNEAGILADGRAARQWLAQRAGIAESEIVLMGESLGGAVATLLAAEAPARGLVLENVFCNLPDVAAYHYPWLPIRALIRTQLNAAEAIQKYHGPLLQIHAGADTIVPIELGRKLFAAANEPKQFLVIPGADHNDPRTPQLFEALNQFLERLPPANTHR